MSEEGQTVFVGGGAEETHLQTSHTVALPLATVCRNCIETLHFYVRATSESVAHCEPCSEVSSSRSFIIILVFLCGVAVAAILVLLSRQLPANIKVHLNKIWHAATDVYRM